MLREQQVDQFGQMLRQRYPQELERIHTLLLQSGEQSYIELVGRVHDSEEAALANLLVDVSLAKLDRHAAEIRAIDAVLRRIARGG